MISERLHKLFLLSIPLFIVHGIEEYLTGFYNVDDILFGHLSPDISQSAFAIFQVLWWIFLITIYKLSKSKYGFNLMIFVGLIYIFELHHLIHALFIEKAYYPGVITAIGFPIFTLFFWKELIKNRRKT